MTAWEAEHLSETLFNTYAPYVPIEKERQVVYTCMFMTHLHSLSLVELRLFSEDQDHHRWRYGEEVLFHA